MFRKDKPLNIRLQGWTIHGNTVLIRGIAYTFLGGFTHRSETHRVTLDPNPKKNTTRELVKRAM